MSYAVFILKISPDTVPMEDLVPPGLAYEAHEVSITHNDASRVQESKFFYQALLAAPSDRDTLILRNDLINNYSEDQIQDTLDRLYQP